MTIERKIEQHQALGMLSELIGQYAWFVRCAEDGILRLEFGDPHLTIQGPKEPRYEGSEAVRRALNRRVVVPTGQWSLFVEDGLWNVEADGLTCSRADRDKVRIETCLSVLSGQKPTSIAIGKDGVGLSVEFDLSGKLSILDELEGDELCQWMLYSKDGIIAYNGEEKIFLEQM